MVIGYSLTASDNQSELLKERDIEKLSKCSKCGFIIDFDYFNPFFKLKKKTYDVSYTYDLKCIVSLRFKEFCLREGYKGLTFREFEWEPNFFQLLVNNIVEMDTTNGKVEFQNYCELCHSYEGTYLQSTQFKGHDRKLEDNFYRSDILFAHGNNKYPLLFIGPDTYPKLKREKMKGLYFEAIQI